MAIGRMAMTPHKESGLAVPWDFPEGRLNSVSVLALLKYHPTFRDLARM